MSVEALHEAQSAAGREIGLGQYVIREIIRAQETRTIYLPTLLVPTDEGTIREVEAARGISGPESVVDDGEVITFMDKGGSRITFRNPRGDLRALPQDMWNKNAQSGIVDWRGRPVNGGKFIFFADPSSFSHNEKTNLFAEASDAMSDIEQAGHTKSVPAGDMGTNHTAYMDSYALRRRNRNDKYWQASITGKSPEVGGTEFRTHNTGYGTYKGMDDARMLANIYGRPARVTFSGSGNVSGYAGYYASQHIEDGQNAFSIRAYSDLGGTLYVENEDEAYGINVDEELLQILDNPSFHDDERYADYKGDKIAAMRDVIARKQPHLRLAVHPDPNYVLKVPTDMFVPASVRDLINEDNIDDVAAMIIVEAGNDTITHKAYQRFLAKGGLFRPGTIVNAEGVCGSMDEYHQNIRNANGDPTKLTFDELKKISDERASARLLRLERMAKALATKDYQKAACALGMANMALQMGFSIDSRIKEIVRVEELSLTR